MRSIDSQGTAWYPLHPSAPVSENRHLFDRFVCRIGGLPADALDNVGSGAKPTHTAYALIDARSAHETAGHALAAALYEEVGRLHDAPTRSATLQLKRDAHNARPLNGSKLSLARTAWAPATARAADAYVAASEASGRAERDFRQAYQQATRQARETLCAAVSDSNFQKGLLVSSRPFFEAQTGYLDADPDTLTTADRSTERSLLRYLSRAALKATPFSTLCGVLPGHIDRSTPLDTDAHPLRLSGDPAAKRSLIRLDKRLFDTLQRYLRTRPEVRIHFGVETNPTVERDAGHLTFLANVDGDEVFQRMPESPVVDLIVRTLGEAAGQVPRLGELAADLADHPALDTTADQVVPYLERLVEIGLLRYHLGVTEQEVDWDAILARVLEPVGDLHAQAIRGLLLRLRAHTTEYADAPLARRAELLSTMQDDAARTLRGLGLPPLPYGGALFYEDAVADAEARLHVAPQLEQDLARYVSLTRPLAYPRSEQVMLRHFLDTNYPDNDTPSVPLLTFYEDFYRSFYKEHRARSRQGGGYDTYNPFKLAAADAVREAFAALNDRMAQRWALNPDAVTLDVEPDDFHAVLGPVPDPASGPDPVSFFAQPYPALDEDPAGLALSAEGSYLAGFGKYFSRFLYLFDDALTLDRRRANAKLSGHLLAEIRGASHYNMNVHPALLPSEISYPTAETGSADAQLSVTELVVESHPESLHDVVLRHLPSGQRVVPVDLGFLSPDMRPPLYALLSWFTPTRMFTPQFPDQPASESGPDAVPPVLRRPRIRFKRSIVLARQQWSVTQEAFPLPGEAEDDEAYFLRVCEWRQHHGIPAEAFAKVRLLDAPLPEASDGSDEAAPGTDAEAPTGAAPLKPNIASRNLHKPQYIDFDNPLFVDLFGRLAPPHAPFLVELVERFPNRDGLPQPNGRPYANELVLELDPTA